MYNLCQNHFATKAHQKQSYLHPGPSFADLIGARIIRRSHKPKPASLGLLQTPVQLLAAFPSPSLRAPQRRGGIEKAAPSGKAKPKPPYRAQAPPKISPSPDGQVRPKSGRPTGAVDPPPSSPVCLLGRVLQMPLHRSVEISSSIFSSIISTTRALEKTTPIWRVSKCHEFYMRAKVQRR